MARKETNFKQTDIGLIPHDWEVATIGDGFKFITNNTLSRGQLTNKGSVLNVHYGDVHVRFSEVLDLEKSTLPFINTGIRRNAKPYLINGDIVMADTAEDETVGKSCEIQNIGEWKVEAGLHTFALRPTQKYAPKFLGYFINSKSFHNQLLPLIQGTKVYSVTKGDLKGTAVLKPPIEEQNRIAEVLSHFDEHIDNLVALLEKRKQVKAATMHALLSGSTRLPGFTALWQETTLEKLCLSMNSGGTPDSKNPNFYNGDIPFLSIADMTLQGKYVSKTTKTITKEGLDNSSARLVRRGILLYAMYASLGKCSLSSIDLSISQAILAIETNPKLLETDYLYYFLTYIEKKVKTLGQTGTQTNLSKQLVKEICVTAPTSVKEQEAIADILSNMDRGIEALEEQVEKYRQMKEGAMEELLTGKVRLV